MKRQALSACLLAVFAFALLAGCSSSPKANPDAKPEVQVRLAPDRDLAHHGVAFSDDPFNLPYQVFSQMLGSKKEFVVMAIDLVLPESSHLVIDGDIVDANGQAVAKLYTTEDMQAFWKASLSSDEPTLATRLRTIDRYYAPSLDFTARKGHREYYVACVGTSPIPRPSTAEIFITLGDGAPQSFYFDLLTTSKKK
jgi:hypothetical protein